MLLELLNKDVVVLEMEYIEQVHAVSGIVRVIEPEYAPPSCIGPNGAIGLSDVAWWWNHRGIPASRPRLGQLLESVGLDDARELVERAMGLSLSDRYWVRPKGSGLTWAEVNFFDNDYSDDLGLLTLDEGGGRGSGANSDDDLMSPNSTVLGDVPKKWVRREGRNYLLKAGAQLFDQDVFNEVVATQLYRRTLKSGTYVQYTVEWQNYRPLSCCENMLDDDEELVTVADLLRRHRGERNLGTYLSVLDALLESDLPRERVERPLETLLALDFLMANFDRHTGNFGLIRNCRTLEYLRFAPYYDCGNSLWCNKRSLANPSDYDYRPRPFLGRQGENAQAQLNLVVDYTWLPNVDLTAWVDESLETLSVCPNISDERLDAIRRGLEMRLGHFERQVARRAKLYPSLSPAWLGVGRATHNDALEQQLHAARSASEDAAHESTGIEPHQERDIR